MIVVVTTVGSCEGMHAFSDDEKKIQKNQDCIVKTKFQKKKNFFWVIKKKAPKNRLSKTRLT